VYRLDQIVVLHSNNVCFCRQPLFMYISHVLVIEQLEDDVMQEALRSGVDLRSYSKQVRFHIYKCRNTPFIG
jgi:hypothetical protein